jgi:hypothetical protein
MYTISPEKNRAAVRKCWLKKRAAAGLGPPLSRTESARNAANIRHARDRAAREALARESVLVDGEGVVG